MQNPNRGLILFLVISNLAAMSCAEDAKDSKNISVSNTKFQKPTSVTASSAAQSAENPLHGQKLIDSEFNVEVKVSGLLGVCTGKLKMHISPMLGDEGPFAIPSGVINCEKLCVKLDFSKIMQPYEGKQNQDIVVKNGVFSLPVMGGMEFEPPRPLMPSFIRLPKTELASLKVSDTVSMFDSDSNLVDEGTISLEVLSLDQAYYAESLGRKFEKTMVYEVINRGFDKGKMLENFLFKKMRFTMSLDPIAILELKLVGNVKKMLGETKESGTHTKNCSSPLSSVTQIPILGNLIQLLPVDILLTIDTQKNLTDSVSGQKTKRTTTEDL